MAFSGHEDTFMHVRRGLAGANHLIDAFGGVYQAASTTLATWQAANSAKDVPATLHDGDRMLVRRSNAYGKQLNDAGIYSNTNIANSDTAALWEAQFTAQDGSLAAAYRGSGLGDD